MPNIAPTSHLPRPFICRFAAGEASCALSAVWRIWSARNQPDLYIAPQPLGGHIKATVHCPRAGKSTWKRHYGFVSEARGEVAEAVLADGTSRHKISWPGAKFGEHVTLEWKIFILASALRKEPLPVSSDVTLIPPPNDGHCLLVAVMIGPALPTTGYPREKDLDTYLLAEDRLCDGRRVWITYCYTPPGVISFPMPANPNPRHYGSKDRLLSALIEEGELRAYAIAHSADGSLGFFDARVERKQQVARTSEAKSGTEFSA